MPAIRSTLPTSQRYTLHTAENGAFVETFSKEIKGGYGLVDKFLQAPDGAVITSVTDDELKNLKKIPLFNVHVDNGFIVVDSTISGIIAGVKGTDSDMEKQSKSSPVKKGDIPDGITVEEGI